MADKIFLSPDQKNRIVHLIRSGVHIHKMRDHGFPTAHTILRLRREDQEFDKAVLAAIRDNQALSRRFRKISESTEAKKAIVEAYRSGKNLGKLGPEFPSAFTIDRWRKNDPQFDKTLTHLIDKRMSYNRSSKDWLSWKDPNTGLLKKESRVALIEYISKSSAIRSMKSTDFPGLEALRRQRKIDLSLDLEIKTANRERRRVAKNRSQLSATGFLTIRASSISSDAIYEMANQSVPRSYPQYIRDDILSKIVLAVLEGEIRPSEIKEKASSFVTSYWRERPEFRLRSLDAPSFDDGSGSLHDIVSKSLWEAQ